MNEPSTKTDAQWRAELSEEQYRITRCQGTEPPFTGAYHDHKADGQYQCLCCRAPLFDSADKYDSGSGWPSYRAPLSAQALSERHDHSHGMQRTEVRCARCQAHLGHVFPDGPAPHGLRYCINSAALHFVARSELP